MTQAARGAGGWPGEGPAGAVVTAPKRRRGPLWDARELGAGSNRHPDLGRESEVI